jgi:polyphosphate kinase 2 (PPK2 family)
MFESAELGHKIDKDIYKKAVPQMRADLLDAQYDLKEQGKIPVIVLVSGQDGAGKGETINVLYEWMDPRFISTLAFSTPTDEERERPFMWRYWRALPPKGRIGIFAGSWYSGPIHDCIDGSMTQAALDQRIDQINRFEQMLVNEGALVLKFWFHLTKEGQRRRLKALEKDPRTAWRVTKWNWDRLKTYDELQEVAGHVLRTTNTPWAPWIIVEGEDDRFRSLTAGKIILDAIRKRLAEADRQATPVAPPVQPNIDGRDIISELDLSHKLSKKQYEDQLAKWQGRLAELVRDPRFRQRSLICVFEGSDAAGKGGSIRRVTAAMDARQYQIIPIAAPTEEERAQPGEEGENAKRPAEDLEERPEKAAEGHQREAERDERRQVEHGEADEHDGEGVGRLDIELLVHLRSERVNERRVGDEIDRHAAHHQHDGERNADEGDREDDGQQGNDERADERHQKTGAEALQHARSDVLVAADDAAPQEKHDEKTEDQADKELDGNEKKFKKAKMAPETERESAHRDGDVPQHDALPADDHLRVLLERPSDHHHVAVDLGARQHPGVSHQHDDVSDDLPLHGHVAPDRHDIPPDELVGLDDNALAEPHDVRTRFRVPPVSRLPRSDDDAARRRVVLGVPGRRLDPDAALVDPDAHALVARLPRLPALRLRLLLVRTRRVARALGENVFDHPRLNRSPGPERRP